MIKFHCNPIQGVMAATENLYPDIQTHVLLTDMVRYWGSRGINEEDAMGVTEFVIAPCEDGKLCDRCQARHDFFGDVPVVYIDYRLNMGEAAECLAHELAHVVVGPDVEEHGKEWEQAFIAIRDEYERLMMATDVPGLILDGKELD